MSADRETNHDMTDRDIAFLLADAADEVEVGTAPVQAVLRGGRRRQARRWAVATITAVVLAASTGGTLAVTGLANRDDHRGVPAAPRPSVTGTSDTLGPTNTTLGMGSDQGKRWKVSIDVWPAPRDEAKAQRLLNAMWDFGEIPLGIHTGSELVGKSMYFLYRYSEESNEESDPVPQQGTIDEAGTLSGTGLVARATGLDPSHDAQKRLVVGHVARTVQQVACTWKDGTTTKVSRTPAGVAVDDDQLTIRPVSGSPDAWFVCLAPKGTEYKTAKVTR